MIVWTGIISHAACRIKDAVCTCSFKKSAALTPYLLCRSRRCGQGCKIHCHVQAGGSSCPHKQAGGPHCAPYCHGSKHSFDPLLRVCGPASPNLLPAVPVGCAPHPIHTKEAQGRNERSRASRPEEYTPEGETPMQLAVHSVADSKGIHRFHLLHPNRCSGS